MKLRRFATCFSTFVVAFAVLGLGSAGAGVVLYDNGSSSYSVNSWSISTSDHAYAVTDSFTLLQSSNVNGVDFVAWTYPGVTPLTVGWAITPAPFGGVPYASGVADSGVVGVGGLVSSSLGSNGIGAPIFQETFLFTNVLLGAGTYWLQLSNATGSGGSVYWDQNSGPSAASLSVDSVVRPLNGKGEGSETFQILGDPTGQTPEPGTAALLGAGLLLAGILRRRLS